MARKNAHDEQAARFARDPGARWRIAMRTEAGHVHRDGEGTFDELVVDHWLHIEQLDERVWWMRVGDARLLVTVEPDGAITVEVERGSYGEIRGATTASEPEVP